MFGNDHYPIKIGLNKNVPFRSYINNEPNLHDINVVAINKPTDRATCIVVEKDGKYADFYYNGFEENFKILTEPGYEMVDEEMGEKFDEPIGSWEAEDFGTTPECILKYGVSQELIDELIEH